MVEPAPRWPATREIESFWYPVWLSYPAGLLPGSRLLDAPAHKVTAAETVRLAREYEFVVLFTSTVGLESDLRLIRSMKAAKPDLKVAFVGPPVQVRPTETLMASEDIDFVVRGEFDYAVAEFAKGKPLQQISGISYRSGSQVIHNASRPPLDTGELDRLPFATEVYKRDLVIENYNVPFLLHPFIALYTSRGCPALCTFCLWPQTLSGHAWRVRSAENVAQEIRQALKAFPQVKEFFFDDDTFNIRKDRVLELCAKFKPLGFRWSCTARVHSDYETLKAMAEAGARLLIVGFESGDATILKNIKKGATLEMARRSLRTAGSWASSFTVISLSACRVRRKIPFSARSISPRNSIPTRYKSPSPTPSLEPSSTTTLGGTISSGARRLPTPKATNCRISNIRGSGVKK